MEQLTQNLKSGEMKLLEVPFPVLNNGCVLVRNHFSIISAGTEGKTVKDARLGYIRKAIARKEEVKKVIKTAKTIGLSETYKLMMNKLDAPTALGYSSSGEVIAVASDVTEFKVGDKVACAGAGAVHAEIVAVQKNLCVKLNDTVPFEEATFTTLGAIALQGIRQSDLRLGENCAVIGLGLLGQLTMQLLNASGVKCFGIDVNQNMTELSRKLGFENCFERSTEGLNTIIRELTNGYGADAVIITAATNNLDPVNFAGEICRQKGKVIIVGSVPTGFDRKNYYRKELELKMSCSYGPGRYDSRYEDEGIDYPYGYVRWTENRNMQAFVDLISAKKINIKPLISHTFNFNEAVKAYQLILDKSEVYTGILLKYDTSKVLHSRVEIKAIKAEASSVNVGFIGAGNFANNVLLPNLKNNCIFIGISSNKPNNTRNIADKYGFSYCTDKADDLISDKNTNTIFIATRHDSHAAYVLNALQNNKHVFTEKPLCLNEDELSQIQNAQRNSKALLMIGFNRRFSPFIQKIKPLLNNQPVAINYRINAGVLDSGHWIHKPTVGGGRIIGEACHFIDLCSFISGSKIKSVSANALQNANHLNDTLTIQLGFENGNVASISYFSNGSKELNKEYLEIFSNGTSIIIDDFKELRIHGKTSKSYSIKSQDKGHKQEIKLFLDSIKEGKPSPIPFDEIYNSMLATFKADESVKANGGQILI